MKMKKENQKNPFDKNFINQLEIKKDFVTFGVRYRAFYENKQIGLLEIDMRDNHVAYVNVNKNYRLRGVATFLYDQFEKDFKLKLKPSESLFEESELFWKNRLK